MAVRKKGLAQVSEVRDQLSSKRAALAAAQQAAQAAESASRVLGELERGFGRTGIQSFVLEAAIGDLQDRTNIHLKARSITSRCVCHYGRAGGLACVNAPSACPSRCGSVSYSGPVHTPKEQAGDLLVLAVDLLLASLHPFHVGTWDRRRWRVDVVSPLLSGADGVLCARAESVQGGSCQHREARPQGVDRSRPRRALGRAGPKDHLADPAGRGPEGAQPAAVQRR